MAGQDDNKVNGDASASQNVDPTEDDQHSDGNFGEGELQLAQPKPYINYLQSRVSR